MGKRNFFCSQLKMAAKSAAVAKKSEVVISEKKGTHKNSNVRLYVKGHFAGYRRSVHNVYPNESILKLEGVHDKADTQFYMGKTVYYALGKKKGATKLIKGKIMSQHGNSGAVIARFERNLPAQAHSVRVMLYPSNL